MIYADYAATTPIDREVAQSIYNLITTNFANASSVHTLGREASSLIENARKEIAKVINADKNEIYFTSGGTESDNWAIQGVIEATGKKHLITTCIEHHAVLNTCANLEKQGIKVTYLPVDRFGRINLTDLKNAISEETGLISIMTANNEIGTLQDIQAIGEIAKEYNIPFHTDAVQAIGNVKIDVKKSNVSLLSLSAHKFYGPKGIGILYIKNGTKIANQFFGGSQERDRRPGTLNTPLIVGLKDAIVKADDNLVKNNGTVFNRAETVRNIILNEIPDTIFNGHPELRLKGNISVSFQGVQSQALLVLLDSFGVMVSAGAACSAGAVTVSHVIKAINQDAENYGTIRISLSHLTTEEEAEAIGNAVVKVVKNLRNN